MSEGQSQSCPGGQGTPEQAQKYSQGPGFAQLCLKQVLEHDLRWCQEGDGGSSGDFLRSPEQQDPALGLTMSCLLG